MVETPQTEDFVANLDDSPNSVAWWRLVIPIAAFALTFLALRGFGTDKAIVGGIFGATVALWMTELLPLAVTALLSTAALVVIAGVPEKKAFGAYGDPIIPLFIGSFLLAKGMEVTGLSKRFAYSMLQKKWASKSPGALLLTLMAVTCSMSLVVSNTATTAMMLPIGLAILSAVQGNTANAFATGALLTLTWGASIAVGVPVSTPPNLIGISQIEALAGVRISFVQWMTFAMPITVTTLFTSWLYLRFKYGKNVSDPSHAAAEAATRLKALGPVRQSEKVVMTAFALALVFWIAPDLTRMIVGSNPFTDAFKARVTTAGTALVAASLLFIVPVSDRPDRRALSWKEGSRIDWGTILLFGGGIALGQALFESGLAKDLGDLAAKASGANTLWTITALCILSSIILSELASNTAAATTLIPVAIALAQGAGVNPVAPALGAALGSSFGFMLPVSTAPNAIVYSSGLVPAREMMRAGIVLDILGFISILACLRIMLPIMGLA